MCQQFYLAETNFASLWRYRFEFSKFSEWLLSAWHGNDHSHIQHFLNFFLVKRRENMSLWSWGGLVWHSEIILTHQKKEWVRGAFSVTLSLIKQTNKPQNTTTQPNHCCSRSLTSPELLGKCSGKLWAPLPVTFCHTRAHINDLYWSVWKLHCVITLAVSPGGLQTPWVLAGIGPVWSLSAWLPEPWAMQSQSLLVRL